MIGASPSDRHRSLVDLCGWPIVIALVARLGLIIVVLARHPGRRPDRLFWTADTQRYLDLAASLLRGEFSTVAGPEVYRLPGYPLFLSPGVALGWPTVYALFAQLLLCCLLVVIVVRTARLMGLGDRAATAAGVLCALEPTLLLWSLQLMADVPLGAVVAAAFLALLMHLRDGSRRALATATVLAAGSAFVKPVAYGLALLVAFVAGSAARKRGGRAASRLLLAAALLGASILGAWHVRNWSATGFSAFSTQVSHVNRTADFAAWRSENPAATVKEIQRERQRRDPATPTATDQPLRIDSSLVARLRLHMSGVWRTLSNPGALTWLQFLDLEPPGVAVSRDLFKNGPWRFLLQSVSDRPFMVAASVLLGGLNLAYWSLFALGFKAMIRRAPAEAWSALLLVAYFALASGGPWGQSRFRIPFVSALCVLAGAAFDRGGPRFSRG